MKSSMQRILPRKDTDDTTFIELNDEPVKKVGETQSEPKEPEKQRRFELKTTSGREYCFNPEDMSQGLNPIDDILDVEDPGPSILDTATNVKDDNVAGLWRVASDKRMGRFGNKSAPDFKIAPNPNYIVSWLGELVPSLNMFVLTPTENVIKRRFVKNEDTRSDLSAMTYVRRIVNGSDIHDVFVASEPFFGTLGSNFYQKVSTPHRGMSNSVEPIIGEDPFDGDPSNTVSYFKNLGIRVALADHKNVKYNTTEVYSNLENNYAGNQTKGETEVVDLSIPIDALGPGVYHVVGFDISFVVLAKDIAITKVDDIFRELKENRISTWDDVLLHQLRNDRVPGMLSPMKCIINTDNESVANSKFYATMGMFPMEVTVNKIKNISDSEIRKNRVTVVFQDNLMSAGKEASYVRVDFKYDKIVNGYTGIKVFGNTVLAIGLNYNDVCKKSADVITSSFYSDELHPYGDDIVGLFNVINEKDGKIDDLKKTKGKLKKRVNQLEDKVTELEKEKTKKHEELCSVKADRDSFKKRLADIAEAEKKEADIDKARANSDTAKAKAEASHIKAEADISTSQSKVLESRLKLGIATATFCIAAFGLYRTYKKDNGIMNKLTPKSYSFFE